MIGRRLADSSQKASDSLWRWIDERLGIEGLDYPVPKHADSIFYSLGEMTLVAFGVLAVTGLVLLQYTTNDPATARESITYLMTRVDFGNFVRSVHFWAANLMLITMVLHLVRVFFTGSYKRPREAQWLIGVLMLVLVSLIYFTGGVIKWDQNGYEAFIHFQEMMEQILGPAANIFITEEWGNTTVLARMFRIHTIILPGFAGAPYHSPSSPGQATQAVGHPKSG